MSYLSNFNERIRDDRQMKALTGLSIEEFQFLVKRFKESYEKIKSEKYEKRQRENPRARAFGGGRKGRLDTFEKKLFFVLVYHKTYPTFDVLGYNFELARSKACENIHNLTPILGRTFEELGVKPKREISGPEEFKEVFGAVEYLIIDVSERMHFRSKDYEKQKKDYSGKKKDIERKIQ